MFVYQYDEAFMSGPYNGYVLERMRNDSPFTQQEMADALGITQPSYHRKEKGKSPLTVEEMAILARTMYNFDVHEYISGRKIIQREGLASDELLMVGITRHLPPAYVQGVFLPYLKLLALHFCPELKKTLFGEGEGPVSALDLITSPPTASPPAPPAAD